jgi:hypothetical protein
MGMTLWIHTLEGINMSKESDDHSMMYRFLDRLDELCTSLHVEKLSSFLDMTDLELNMAEDFDVEMEEEPEEDPETGYAYGIEEMKWFDAAVGLKTFQSLRSHIASTAIDTLEAENKPILLEELDDCIKHLTGPAARGGKFNLPVVM